MPCSVTVDAFPKLRLHGHVDSWSPGTGSTFALLPPDNATGNFTKVVQRVPVKIVLDPDPALGTVVRPGMSVVATIETADAAPAPTTPVDREDDRPPARGGNPSAMTAAAAPVTACGKALEAHGPSIRGCRSTPCGPTSAFSAC